MLSVAAFEVMGLRSGAIAKIHPPPCPCPQANSLKSEREMETRISMALETIVFVEVWDDLFRIPSFWQE